MSSLDTAIILRRGRERGIGAACRRRLRRGKKRETAKERQGRHPSNLFLTVRSEVLSFHIKTEVDLKLKTTSQNLEKNLYIVLTRNMIGAAIATAHRVRLFLCFALRRWRYLFRICQKEDAMPPECMYTISTPF